MSIKDIDAGQDGIIRKGNDMRKIWLVLVFLGVCTSLSAETRMWTDATEGSFEGTYHKELLGGVQIKDLKGRSHLIRMEQLSKADLDYIEYYVAPEVKVKVNYDTRMLPRTEWSREDDDTTAYTFNVKVEKTSRFPHKGGLSAELFVVANERSVQSDKHLVLMHREKTNFAFAEEKKSLCEFSVSSIQLNAYLAGWIRPFSVANRGQTYLGYIVAISNSSGQIIFCDTDIAGIRWLTDDLPLSVEKLRDLYINHHGSAASRHFNDSFKKISPPNVRWFQRNPTI